MNTIDLQIQSTASDGKHTPADIVAMAKEEGVAIISLTDHDTVAGVDEVLEAGQVRDVRVIPGIEMSVEEHGLHILGYGIDHRDGALLGELEKFRQGRLERAKKMTENLRNAGFVIEWEDVLKQATGAVIARPHLARAALGRPENRQKLGTITTVHDFIEAFISDESPSYVHRTHVSARDAIALLNRVGGVAVWSHPAIHFREDPDGLERMLGQFIEWGIEGVEVFNPSHTEDDAEYLGSLAAKYKLLCTAGSDFHEKKPSSRDSRGLHAAERIGDYETHGFPTDGIIEALDKAMAKRGALESDSHAQPNS